MIPRATRSILSLHSLAGWALFGALLGFAGVAAAQDDLKVAVVDVARVFKEYGKTQELDAKIAEARHNYELEMDDRMQGHHRLLEDLARLDKSLANPALGATEKTDLAKQRAANLDKTRRLEGEIRDFKLSRERALQEMTLRVRTQIVEDIMEVVNARVETKHYDLVVSKSGRGQGDQPVVMYASDRLDITGDVVATLNQTHPAAKAATPAATP